jgi:hypothetical protein
MVVLAMEHIKNAGRMGIFNHQSMGNFTMDMSNMGCVIRGFLWEGDRMGILKPQTYQNMVVSSMK